MARRRFLAQLAVWPLAERKIPIFACGTCARARGITEADLANWRAQYGNPKIFVSLVEWADRVFTE
jgi:sulfur relay (sulfurtransferase) complex TusBCD TusD component (DsrE family)